MEPLMLSANGDSMPEKLKYILVNTFLIYPSSNHLCWTGSHRDLEAITGATKHKTGVHAGQNASPLPITLTPSLWELTGGRESTRTAHMKQRQYPKHLP